VVFEMKTQMKNLAALLGLMLTVGPAWAEYGLNMPKGVTPFSETVYVLHMQIFLVCVVIALVVFGAMFYSMFKHRKSLGVEPATFSHSTKAEVLWTVIPILILVVMAVPATTALIEMEQTADAEMTVKITGYQWKWKYDYIEDDLSFLSTLSEDSNKARQLNSGIDPRDVENYLLDVDNPLVLPTNTKIRFLITADDVIHAWWVPDFGWKRDAIPGIVNEAWTEIREPGVYRGQCAELCGKDHGFMPIVVIAKEPSEYLAWVADQKDDTMIAEKKDEAQEVDQPIQASNITLSQQDLMQRGETVYNQQCAVCHQANGEGMNTIFPALAGSEVATGPVQTHLDVVINGRPGTQMQAFGQLLNDDDLAAALTYTRNAWGNNTQDNVQPKDVRAARRG